MSPGIVEGSMITGTGPRILLTAVVLACVGWFGDPLPAAENEPVVQGVRVETGVVGKVGVFVQLNSFLAPTCFSLSGDPVRVVCDFPGADLAKSVERRIEIEGDIVQWVRIGAHRDPEKKVRIVLDVNPERDFVVDQLFVKKDNQYVLVVEPEGNF
jgi:energy-converting hydrogenase Eha subunit E